MKPTFSLAGLLATAVLLTGCGAPAPDDPTTSAPATSAAATDPASGAPTSPDATDPATSAPAEGSEVSVEDFFGRQPESLTTYTFTMSGTTSAGPMDADGVADFTDRTQPAQHLTMTTGGQEFELIVIKGEVYMKMAALGDQWVKLSAEQAAAQGLGIPNDPTESLNAAKQYVQKIEVVGQETLDGVETTHYRLTMDAEGLSEVAEEEDQVDVDSFVQDVWLDAENRPRRTLVEIAGGSDPVTLQTDITGFGDPVTIEAPESFVEMGG